MLADRERLCDELMAVRRRRFKEAQEAGLSLLEAKLFAENDQDVGILRALVKGHCSVELMAEIVT